MQPNNMRAIRILLALAVGSLGLACAGPVPDSLGVQAAGAGLAPCPASPNCVTSGAADAVHSVAAFRIAGDVADGWSKIREAVQATTRTDVVTYSDRYLHAESTSLWMRYVDDLELLLDPATGRVDVRSASRVGYGDMGVNAARVQALRTQLIGSGVLAP